MKPLLHKEAMMIYIKVDIDKMLNNILFDNEIEK